MSKTTSEIDKTAAGVDGEDGVQAQNQPHGIESNGIARPGGPAYVLCAVLKLARMLHVG